MIKKLTIFVVSSMLLGITEIKSSESDATFKTQLSTLQNKLMANNRGIAKLLGDLRQEILKSKVGPDQVQAANKELAKIKYLINEGYRENNRILEDMNLDLKNIANDAKHN